jgi:hypothetical protein
MDERDMQEKGKDREGKGWGKEKNVNIWNCYLYFVIRNPKAWRALQRL